MIPYGRKRQLGRTWTSFLEEQRQIILLCDSVMHLLIIQVPAPLQIIILLNHLQSKCLLLLHFLFDTLLKRSDAFLADRLSAQEQVRLLNYYIVVLHRELVLHLVDEHTAQLVTLRLVLLAGGELLGAGVRALRW